MGMRALILSLLFYKTGAGIRGSIYSQYTETLKKYIPTDFRLLKGALADASDSLHLYAENNVLYLMFYDVQNTPVCLSLHEPGLLFAFDDYINHMPAEFYQDSFSKC